MKKSKMRSSLVMLGLVGLLSGCTTLPAQLIAPNESPVITGTPVRRNFTPLEPAFSCMAEVMRDRKVPVLQVAVGDVKDYTGKYSQNEGNAITQGGTLMIYSALGKMGGAVQLQERFDTRIAELELAYTDKRQLGDGRSHSVEPGKPSVPWVPYFGGSILRSSYYIVGGITELNYNIASSGAELVVSGVGGKRRTYTMNIGVDLRIVDTRTLVVLRTVSLQKQVIGEEVGAGIYRFFGNALADVNVGVKNQEPLQLGVRTTIEHGVLELIAAIAGIDPSACIDASGQPVKDGPVLRQPVASGPTTGPVVLSPIPVASAEVTTAAAVAAGTRPQNLNGASASGTNQQVPFDFGSATISVQAMSVLEKVASEALQGRAMTMQLVARDTENFAGTQRRELTNQRIDVITQYLVGKGVAAQRVGVTWMPAPTEQQITRAGAGFQLVASLAVAR